MSRTDPSVADGSVEGTSGGEPVRAVAPPATARPAVPHAFPREARLLDGRSYDAVFADNRRVADRFWTVLAHRVPPGTPSDAKLGLAVAKKRARRAVDRNRIKRAARESFRHARVALDGYHLVVMNRDAATGAQAAELRAALDTLWSRLLRQSPGQGERREPRPYGRRSSARAESGARPDGASADAARAGATSGGGRDVSR